MQLQHLVLFVPSWMNRRLTSRNNRLSKLDDYHVVKNVFSPADLAALLYINRHADVFIGGNQQTAATTGYQMVDGAEHLITRWKEHAVKTQLLADIDNINMLSQSDSVMQDVKARLYCDGIVSPPPAACDAYTVTENEGNVTFVIVEEKMFSSSPACNFTLQATLVKQIVTQLYRHMTQSQVASTYFYRRYLEHLSMQSAA